MRTYSLYDFEESSVLMLRNFGKAKGGNSGNVEVSLKKDSDNKYTLQVNGEAKGTIDLPKDRFLTEATVGDDNKLTFKVDNGEDVKVDLSKFVDTYTIPTKISDLEDDSDFAKKTYVDTEVAKKQDKIDDLASIRSKAESALQEVPEEYVTETELAAKGYETTADVNTKLGNKQDTITDLQTIREKATSALQAGDIVGKADTTYVNTELNKKVDSATYDTDKATFAKTSDIPSLDGYAKTTDIPSLDGYVTTDAMNQAIAAAATGGTVDLSEYAKKTEIKTYTAGDGISISEQNVISADVKASDLTSYATKTELGDYVKTADLPEQVTYTAGEGIDISASKQISSTLINDGATIEESDKEKKTYSRKKIDELLGAIDTSSQGETTQSSKPYTKIYAVHGSLLGTDTFTESITLDTYVSQGYDSATIVAYCVGKTQFNFNNNTFFDVETTSMVTSKTIEVPQGKSIIFYCKRLDIEEDGRGYVPNCPLGNYVWSVDYKIQA